MLGTTWSASKQAGRQATWQAAAAGTEVQKGVALSRVRDERESGRRRKREREEDGFGRVHGIGVGGRSHEGGK